MNESWLKETMGLIEVWQTERNELDFKLKVLINESEELDKNIAGAQALVQAYRNKYNVGSLQMTDMRPGYFGDKSYSEMTVQIAKQTGGYLKVTDAVEIMLKADVSKNKRAIQANTYAALRRMRDHFVKVKKGEYRYTNGIPQPSMPQSSISKPNTTAVRQISGVRQAVKDLKEKNPQMTKQDMLNTLIRSGFDFKGRTPFRAVNMAWASLGYSKTPEQPSLPPA